MNDETESPLYQPEPQKPEAPQAEPPKIERPIIPPEEPRKRGKSKKILLVIVALGAVAIAVVMFSGLLDGGTSDLPVKNPDSGFGLPEGDQSAPAVQSNEGPYEATAPAPVEPAVQPTPVSPAIQYIQQCTDKFNNDIRARGQNPDEMADAREQYVIKCVDYLHQQTTGR